MKKRKFILPIILLLAVAGLCIYFYPAWHSAKILQKNMDLAHFTYEMALVLDKEELPEEQAKLLDTLAELTGFEQEAVYQLAVRGSVWEDKIHILLYPKSAAKPLVELYLSDGADVINESMLYNAIRDNLAGKNALLGLLLPVEEEDCYMTLKQVEQIFEVDLGGIRDFGLPFMDQEFTVKQCFAALAAMSRNKQTKQYELSAEQVQICLSLPGEDDLSSVNIRFDVEKPADVFSKEAELLSRLGVELPIQQLSMLNSLSVTVGLGEGERLTMPENMVSQEKIDLIAQIRQMVKKMQDIKGAL